MEIIERLEDITKPFHNAVVTIGNFDGVHIGHRTLFHKVISLAKEMDGTSVALTFEPHPARVLEQNNELLLITPHEQKKELMSDIGLDVLVCVPFTKEFSAIPAREFIRDILVNRIGMRAIVAGKDYAFGKDREGNLDFLQSCSRSLDYKVHVIDWVLISNGLHSRMSSTKIRELLMDGAVAEAQQLLGRHFQLRGVVVSGRNRGGKVLGFPTANVKLQGDLCPRTGVYAVTVELRGRKYNGVANIGYSPTFDDHLFTIEIHILDFNADVLGEKIRVNFVRRIRDEVKFATIAELSKKIHEDIEIARDLLK
ncbi:MAG: bifunctional riboflavin kinase/FAD synthetase [Desulfobacterales bacterium]|nr:bifunctional riboflavin kinase/FAD synthetase [Desulfobacterales bacterium]